jgi:hypothetical protein
MQVPPQPVFRVAWELVNSLSSLADVQNESDNMIDAVNDWRQKGSPQNNPNAGVHFHCIGGPRPGVRMSVNPQPSD